MHLRFPSNHITRERKKKRNLSTSLYPPTTIQSTNVYLRSPHCPPARISSARGREKRPPPPPPTLNSLMHIRAYTHAHGPSLFPLCAFITLATGIARLPLSTPFLTAPSYTRAYSRLGVADRWVFASPVHTYIYIYVQRKR